MKFTLNWLSEHLDTRASLEVIESTLTNIGLEVESIEDRSKELKDFTVAKVISAKKHPNADRLKVCQVETNHGMFQVVCGAPNACTGMLGGNASKMVGPSFPFSLSPQFGLRWFSFFPCGIK